MNEYRRRLGATILALAVVNVACGEAVRHEPHGYRVGRVASTQGSAVALSFRAGTGVEFYGSGPIGDLTDIDWAPNQVYSPAPIDARVGWGYVFEMTAADLFARYGGIRISHVGQDFLILDWSYQTDPGNPELVSGGGVRTALPGGVTVAH
jgi:hypothetical protein